MTHVDVLITAFNAERFIRDSIESIIRQTHRDWRMIVVDDGSTDATRTILEQYQQQDPRILVVEGPHSGIAAAANTGLAHVTAPYLARIDADDIATPDRLATQVQHLLQHPDIVAVGSQVLIIDEHNRPQRTRKVPVAAAEVRARLPYRNCMCHPSTMLRTDAVMAIGGYRRKFRNSLDYDLWLRLLHQGEIGNLPQTLLHYRKHAGQVSSRRNAHRQTLYSVAAATDFFLQRYGLGALECAIDENNCNDIARKIILLYGLDLAQQDISAINRHAVRFLRYVRHLSPSVVSELRMAIRPRSNLLTHLKLATYALERKIRT